MVNSVAMSDAFAALNYHSPLIQWLADDCTTYMCLVYIRYFLCQIIPDVASHSVRSWEKMCAQSSATFSQPTTKQITLIHDTVNWYYYVWTGALRAYAIDSMKRTYVNLRNIKSSRTSQLKALCWFIHGFLNARRTTHTHSNWQNSSRPISDIEDTRFNHNSHRCSHAYFASHWLLHIQLHINSG